MKDLPEIENKQHSCGHTETRHLYVHKYTLSAYTVHKATKHVLTFTLWELTISPVTLLYHFYYQIQHQLLPVCSISTPYTVPTSKICVKHKSSNVFPVILVPALFITSILLHVIISK